MKERLFAKSSPLSAVFLLIFTFALQAVSVRAEPAPTHWWKGNLHTHSLWSDGDDYPEMIIDWYKQHGYDFLGLSDHNLTQTGERWTGINTNRGRNVALERYIERFGTNWVEQKTEGGKTAVRLKTFKEFRDKFEEPNRFLLILSEEISAHYKVLPIHMCVSNLREVIEPREGNSPAEVIQNNVNAVLAQRKKTGQPMIPHINHPNFGWALTAEDIMGVKGDRFLEIYNGHPFVRNYGDTNHASVERIWDIVLTRRLAEFKLDPIWGTAVDDAHNYLNSGNEKSFPGRGWLMVRAKQLTPKSLIAAMEAGDFYASSGVRLKDVRREKDKLCIEIEPEEGVTYTTRFIGTLKGYDPKSEPVAHKDGSPFPTTRRYSDDIGKVLGEVKGTSPVYTLKGNEIYVRAKVISSKAKTNYYAPGDVETAWVQPLVTGVK
ncbi:MAG: hypothetical protein JWQ71_2950 [Pedosphaera sp.]|nr:hypothetical protein [Pedosphaera sp.]